MLPVKKLSDHILSRILGIIVEKCSNLRISFHCSVHIFAISQAISSTTRLDTTVMVRVNISSLNDPFYDNMNFDFLIFVRPKTLKGDASKEIQNTLLTNKVETTAIIHCVYMSH